MLFWCHNNTIWHHNSSTMATINRKYTWLLVLLLPPSGYSIWGTENWNKMVKAQYHWMWKWRYRRCQGMYMKCFQIGKNIFSCSTWNVNVTDDGHIIWCLFCYVFTNGLKVTDLQGPASSMNEIYLLPTLLWFGYDSHRCIKCIIVQT